MPRLPTAADLGFGAPRAGPQLVELRAPRASAALGEGLGRMAEVFAREAEDLARTQATDALNQLRAARQEMTVGEGGFATLEGKDVLGGEGKPGALVAYPERFNRARETIAATLGTPFAQKLFNQRAGEEETAMRGDLMRHVAVQSLKYKDKVSDTAIKDFKETAARLEDGDPERTRVLGAAALEVAQVIARHGGDEKMAAAAIRDLRSDVHVLTIERLIAEKKDAYAEQYFKKFKGEISTDKATALTTKLDVASNFGRATRAADEVWAEMTKGKNYNDPIDISAATAKVRAQFPDEPKVAAAAAEVLRERKRDWDASQTETNSSNINGVGDLIARDANWATIANSPAYQALPGEIRSRIRIQYESREHAKAGRAASVAAREASEAQRRLLAAQRADEELYRKNIDAYLQISDPANLVSMNRDDVRALWPTFGIQRTAQLVAQYDQYKGNPEAVRAATLDISMFNEIAAETGVQSLNPYTPRRTPEQKEALNNARSAVLTEIGRQQQTLRRALTTEEKQQIARDTLRATVVTRTNWFAPDETTPVAALTRKQFQDLKVPKEIRAAMARDRAAFPDNPLFHESDENLKRYYLRTLQGR